MPSEGDLNARFVAHLRYQPGRRFVMKFNDRIRRGVPDILVVGPSRTLFIEAKKSRWLKEGWDNCSDPQKENLQALSEVATAALLVFTENGKCGLRIFRNAADTETFGEAYEDVGPLSFLDMVKYVGDLTR
jgi:hypothetical protein